MTDKELAKKVKLYTDEHYEDKDEYSDEETKEDSEVTTIGIHFMASPQED